MAKMFDKPNAEEDARALADEGQRGGGSLGEMFWRPVKNVENLIRVLPRRGGSKASWHMRVGKHFIQHGFLPDGKKDTEGFICMKEIYGLPCPACDHFDELNKTDKKAAAPFRVRRSGVFYVVDRTAYYAFKEGKGPFPSVKLYEGPIKAVWETLIKLVNSKGRMSNIFDTFNEDGTIKTPGRDISLMFNPEATPQSMYRLQAVDPTPLGTKEECLKWAEQMRELIPENIWVYAPIDEEVARIKLFGSLEERQELKKAMCEANDAAKQDAPPKVKESEMPVDEEEAVDEEELAAAVEAPAEEEEAKPEPPKAAPKAAPVCTKKLRAFLATDQ